MRRNIVLTSLMVALVSGGAIVAQDTSSAVLTGRVTSNNGAPLQGVRVTIESPSLLGNRYATTDAGGNFRVVLLPNGQYTITYSLNNFITRKLSMHLVAGTTSNGSISLKSIDVQSVTVNIEVEEKSQIDKTDTVVQTAFGADFLEKVSSRTLGGIGAFASGLSTPDLQTQGALNIRGGTGRSTKVLVNGATTTELYQGYTYDSPDMEDLIESIAVIQSPLNARYGNTDGGIVSVVTSKGSNTFTATIRAYLKRDGGWKTKDNGYLFRNGDMDEEYVSGTGVLNKEYHITVQGPIWKDRITFAYGAKLTPTEYGTFDGFRPWGNAPFNRPEIPAGTYYKAPNGDVIRRPELYAYNSPDSVLNGNGGYVYNQFALRGQITPEHQVEYNYAESSYDYRNFGLSWTGITEPGGTEYVPIGAHSDRWAKREWSMAYKGIIGSGILETRYSKTFNAWMFGNGNNFPVASVNMASRFPINPAGDLGDPSNYYQNGIISRLITSGNADLLGYSGTTYPLTAINISMGNGSNVDVGDAGETVGLQINYQHFLNTNMGSHMIDVGMQSDDFSWVKKPGGAEFMYTTAGRIARDLGPADIYNPAGVQSSQQYITDNYAGKFIVFNPYLARFSDVDPWAVSTYGINDDYIVNPTTGMLHPAFGNLAANNNNLGLPSVRQFFGNPTGDYHTKMTSYYINDLWSINDYHSLQVGLRMDNYKAWDQNKTFISYTQPTPRFEYKWDIHGDQSRLLNVSWGQFHSMQPAVTISAMSDGRLDHRRVSFWNKGTDGKPYLVDIEDVLNLDNYTMYEEVLGGGKTYRMDKNWKAPISTEIAVGMRRNLEKGGYWKVSFVHRTWENEYDWYPGEIFVPENTTAQNLMRVLKNAEGYERRYFGLETEWDFPITKDVTFGGSYTFSRLMSNAPAKTEQDSGSNAINLDAYWDSVVPGGRSAWAPVRLLNPEHYFKFYLLFDLSSGKFNSSLSFRGSYTSGVPIQDTFNYRYGYPVLFYPGVFNDMTGNTNTGIVGANAFGRDRTVPINTLSTRMDKWEMRARYVVSVPLVNKITWFANIDIVNPFNHRALGEFTDESSTLNSWFNPGNAGSVITPPNTPTNLTPIDPYGGVWRSDGDFRDYYRSRQPGREFYLETGLKF